MAYGNGCSGSVNKKNETKKTRWEEEEVRIDPLFTTSGHSLWDQLALLEPTVPYSRLFLALP